MIIFLYFAICKHLRVISSKSLLACLTCVVMLVNLTLIHIFWFSSSIMVSTQNKLWQHTNHPHYH